MHTLSPCKELLFARKSSARLELIYLSQAQMAGIFLAFFL